MNHIEGTAQAFWERIFAQGDADEYSRVETPAARDQVLEDALAMFGDVAGKRILDVGCGSGKASLFFASHGAEVTSVDLSSIAIANLTRFCSAHGIANVTPQVMSAMDVGGLAPFDFI